MPLEFERIRHVIVTGAGGYIGRYLVDEALAAGLSVTVLARSSKADQSGLRSLEWKLGDDLPVEAIDQTAPLTQQAIIHLAHDWRDTSDGGDSRGINFPGTRRLLEASRTRGIGRFVFVSSVSARIDAANCYGRIKWSIEQQLKPPREVAARVGLAYGGRRQAMYGLLVRLCGLSPILPMIDPWRQVQPIHVLEVARGLLRIMDHQESGWFGLASSDGVAFGAFLKTLAAELHGKSLSIFPIPLKLALLACEIAARLPLAPKIDKERILGLAGTRHVDTADHLKTLGLFLMPLVVGLRREPLCRKAILAEARTFFCYILAKRPGGTLLRRYAKAIILKQNGAPLPLPPGVRIFPTLLHLVEPLKSGQLHVRLSLATTLAEASPEGEQTLAAGGRLRRLLAVSCRLGMEVLWIPFRLLGLWLNDERTARD